MSSLTSEVKTQEKDPEDISFEDTKPQLRVEISVQQYNSTQEKTEIFTQLSQGETPILNLQKPNSLLGHKGASKKSKLSSLKNKNTLKKRSGHMKRIKKYIQEKQEKTSKLAEEISQSEMQECTFRPQTNNKNTVRSIEDFLKDQSDFSQHVSSKREKLLSERTKLPSEASFTPSINKNSRRCATRYSSNVYDYLYSQTRTPVSVSEEAFSFVPSINSQYVRDRPGDVHLHLYNKAISQTSDCSGPSLRKKLISKTSEAIVTSKFKKEFNLACSDLQKGAAFSYSMYVRLLQKLNFVKSDTNLALQSWDLLCSSERTVKKQQILLFLLSVMNYKSSFPEAHYDYRAFYLNRINEKSHSKSCGTDDLPFKPTISSNSQRLAKNKLAERDPDFLYNEKNLLRHKFSKIRTEKAKEEMTEHTFSPEINKKKEKKPKKETEHRALALYTLSSVKREETKSMIEEAVIDQRIGEQQTCPFSPSLRSPLLKDKKKTVDFKGVNKAVERIKKGRSDTAKRKTMLVRGITFCESDESFKFDKSPLKALPMRKITRSLTRRESVSFNNKKIEQNKSADLSEDSDFDSVDIDN